jgi:thiamine-phosphate pyrophosphorylase
VRAIDVSLYVIVDRAIEDDIPIDEFAAQVIEGGATCIQLRCKNDPTRTIMELGRRVLGATRPAGVPLIVNDRADVALAIEAEGVHLGQDDMPVSAARRICGDEMIVGVTVRNAEAAKAACDAGADYLGVGPAFATPVKPGLVPIPRGVITEIRRGISLPIVAIGGINDMNAAIPLREGADGVAVISALRQCESPREAASRLRSAIDNAKKR